MDKIRLAVVGPADSVALIHEVAMERSDYLEPVSIVYQDASEVTKILERYENNFDIWLFSGIVPYQRALALKTNKSLFYIPHTGASLYRALLQITHIEQLAIESISFDTFSQKEVEETFHDIDLPLPKIYVNHYAGIVSAGEITEYHYNLWKDGKTNIAVTCFWATYENLKKLGVPIFRIWPTRSNIRTGLAIAINAFEAQRFKGSQLAIQHIAIEDYDDIVRDSSSYSAKRIELRLYEILVGYAEMLKGSLVLRGGGQFTLYSTRGILEETTEKFTIMPIFEDITRNVAAKVSGGIGFGSTAYAAEENAFQALGIAKQKGKGRWMVVTDNREVIGPLSSAVHLKYSIRADDAACRKFAEQLNISLTTVNKLLVAIDKLDKDVIGADELAMYLAITPRSARRLLNTLVDQGLAGAAGEELLVKGRPRKLYKIFFDLLLRPMMNLA
ncbi:MAG: hypothetical protein ABFC57_12505 [Veillonellales bacterium]